VACDRGAINGTLLSRADESADDSVVAARVRRALTETVANVFIPQSRPPVSDSGGEHMKFPLYWLIAVAVLSVGFSARPNLAVSPSAVMVYGGKLGQPILLQPAGPADFPAFGLLWWKAGSYANPSRTVQGNHSC
jgi:hypothetical protein